MVIGQLQTHIGFSSDCGKRPANEDFAAACPEAMPGRASQDMLAVIADGLGGGPGGRLAAETSVRGFIDAYYSLPETLGTDRLAGRALSAMNRWLYAQSWQGPNQQKMATTLSALILRGRNAHIVHIGDTRIYRLREDRLQCLTLDHVHTHPDLKHVLYRAVGLESDVRADYAVHALRQHDRFLLCSDGIHGVLSDERIRRILQERVAPADGARQLVDASLQAGSQDNATALIVDVLDIPTADRANLETTAAALALRDLPAIGDVVDGFRLLEIVSDGRYSRLFRAEDTQESREVILKFPHPRITTEENYRRAFVREAWVAAQVRNPWVAEVIELPPGRQSCLYSVMPFYSGETLERRLCREPRVGLEEGVEIGIKLAKAVYALNRLRIIHRDIKPENVMLVPDGKRRDLRLKLLDLGVALLSEVDVVPGEEIPGTPSYMAPELFDGNTGDERSDLFALGVTLYRLFSAGHYPYGEVEAFSHPRFAKRIPLGRHRPDLPAWLDAVLTRATAPLANDRFGDSLELVFELENGLAHGPRMVRQKLSWYERNPLRFWQVVAFLLLMAMIVLLVVR